MRYGPSDVEWSMIKPMLPNKPRGVPVEAQSSAEDSGAGFLNGEQSAAHGRDHLSLPSDDPAFHTRCRQIRNRQWPAIRPNHVFGLALGNCHENSHTKAEQLGAMLAGTPPPYSDDELSKQRRRQRPAGTADCSLKIGRAIRCKSLQALQQRRDGHEGWPYHERSGPSETDNRRDHEIADEVVYLPTEFRAGRQLAGPSAANTSRTIAATLQNFAMSLIVILSDPLFVSGCRWHRLRPPEPQTFGPLAHHLDEIMPMQ